jgi:gentisate 1,2-dioxygenase
VFKGSGYTVIEGVRFDWSEGDFLVIPNWLWHEHAALEDSYLFSASDLPIMEMFEAEREEAYEEHGGRQTVTGRFVPLLP